MIRENDEAQYAGFRTMMNKIVTLRPACCALTSASCGRFGDLRSAARALDVRTGSLRRGVDLLVLLILSGQ